MVWLTGVQGLEAATTRYVWRDNPDTPVPPYDGGWASAATNLQDALDVAVDGDTVLVTNGVYNAGGRIAPGDTTLKTRAVVTNAVTVISVNGPEVTLIVGQPHSTGGLGDTAVRGVYLPTNSVLSGFTVTNGFTRSSSSATTASYVGGGIRCEGTSSLVTNCVVVGNSAAMRGGGIYQGTVIACDILTNVVVSSSSSAGGGGVHSASVHHSLLERNVTLGSSTDGGGAHTCEINQCTLRSNVSGRHGGGACGKTLVSCTVESNRAKQYGGGAYAPLVVSNSLIRWNTAGRSGGGLFKGLVTDSVIASNTVTLANYYGGGYYGDDAGMDRLVSCLVVGNSVITYGGGVYNAVLSNCVVQANRALGSSAITGNGGGYYASTAIGYQVFNTRFLDNEANYQGGGAYQGKFFNCVFSGNRAARGGGAYLASTTYKLNNCTVMGNTATNLYGGTYSGGISNSIVMANTAVTSPNYSGGTFVFSCADPLPAGAGNTNVNPLVSGYRDPHLLPGSPLLGAGAVSGWMEVATDLDGDARLSEGLVDIGADQFTGSTLEGPLAVDIVASTNVWALNWPNTLRAEACGRAKGISWAFGDGATAGNVNPVTHSFAAPGPYTVTVTVSNETHTATATCEITVVDYIVYASPTGGHVPPFASWADAATNLQEAVDAVVLPGGRVLATNGVYDVGARLATGQTVTNRLVLDKAVRVESVNGPEATAIVGRWHSEETPLGAAAIRGVYVGGEAVLCGFTLSHGATAAASNVDNGRGGGIFLAAGGVATNCVIADCRAWSGGGAAGAGTLRACVVRENEALTAGYTQGQGGGMAGLNATGCLIATNTAYQGGGAYDCTLEGCELLDNTASYQGGGAYYGILSRCRVLRNVAGSPSSGVAGGVFDATLVSCLIAGNSARQGGGVYGSTAAKGMFNCTVINNTAWVTGTTQGGGGFYGNGIAYPVRNCIVYYNTSGGFGPNLYQGTVTYTCSLPLPAGDGNTDAAPLLADLTEGRLLAGSPCVGVGLYEPWMAGALDLEGEARSEGGSVDMGADQLFEDALEGPLAVAISGPVWPYFPGTNYTFTALITGEPTHVHWDLGDNTSVTQMPQVVHAWPEGDFTLTLTASNATHSAQATLELNVAPDTRYVSPAGSHTPPFRSWETAATNLQDAADVVMAGGRIQVRAGVYDTGGRVAGGTETLLSRLFVTNGVAVTAVDGPETTFIVGAASGAAVTNGLGDGAVRGVRLLPGSSLSGFTVTGGRTRWTTTGIEGDFAGGGIYCLDNTCVVSNCVVTSCAAAARGGGIYRGRVLDTLVEGNSVYSSGGSLGYGGGISHAAVISNCVLRANEARAAGGGAYMKEPIFNTVFDNNHSALGGGGGCFMETVGVEMRDCTIINNTAATVGGGVVSAALTDCLLTNNTAGTDGGAFYSGSDTTLKRCRIEYNRATGRGGGCFKGNLYRCRLICNTAGGSAGGIYYGTLYSCVVAGNRAGGNGGGAYFSTLECSTVVDNEAARGGGSYEGTAYFSILYYNRAPLDPQYSVTESYGCCTEPYELYSTYGPILQPPQLTGLRDPHLLAGSPCVDSGDYRPWMQGVNGLDLDEEARYGVGLYDVGADERQEAGLTGALSVTVSADQETVGPGYAPILWAEATGRVGELRWDFSDGGSATNLNPVRHTFTEPGVYEVIVTVSNQTHVTSATQTVTVVAGDVFVSPSGTHVPPFSSWATAATNIQEAVDVALWGGTVWLADGDYDRGGRPGTGLSHTNRVCIEKALTLRGHQGPDGVILRGAWHEPGVTACGPGAVRGVYLGHAEARLLDLTVTGGASGTAEDDGGGIFATARNTLASNCVVTACTAYDEGGGVFGGTWQACELRENNADYYGGGASQANVLNSLLSDNTAYYDGGGAYESTLSDTVLTGNVALQADGGGLSYCTALRCRLSNNSAYDDGGASSDSDLVNCLLHNNTAAYGGGAAYGTLELCTVVTNTATVMGGGLYCVNPVKNSIVWGNGAPLDTEYTDSYFDTSFTAPLPSGESDLGGNITGAPEFVNPAASNFRLRGSSPCVNTGKAEGYAVEEDATDLDGRIRVLGSAVDRGAYEYEAAPGFAALGTPIDWLDDYFEGPDWDALELDDPDNDGFKTWEEYIALTNPTLKGSRFAIAEILTTETGVTLSFDTAEGRVYTVLAGETPASVSQPVGSAVPGSGGRVTVPVSDPGPFYRVRVSLP